MASATITRGPYAVIADHSSSHRAAWALRVAVVHGCPTRHRRAPQTSGGFRRRRRALADRVGRYDLRLCGKPVDHRAAVHHRQTEAPDLALVCRALELVRCGSRQDAWLVAQQMDPRAQRVVSALWLLGRMRRRFGRISGRSLYMFNPWFAL